MLGILVRGVIGGVLAAIPMTLVMPRRKARLPRTPRYSFPPRRIVGRVAGAAGVRHRLSRREESALALGAHVKYAGLLGMLFSLLTRGRGGLLSGGIYGLCVWAINYLGVLPALRILPPATRFPKRENQQLIGAHAVWGAALGAVVAWSARRKHCFAGQTVLITGGSRGLGLELARAWAAEGARVAICARSQSDLQTAVDELRGKGAEVIGIECDVTQPYAVRGMVSEVVDRWSRIDVLVNNAGTIQVAPSEMMTEDDYHQAMDTHFWGPYHAIEAALPHMRSQQAGRIVNITSIGGKISVPHLLPYSASKFALVGYSEGLRAELAREGIVVTTICPGLMRTGSPRNALFKGQHRKEYAWFSISDSLPGLSIDSRRAARQIVEACRRGDAYRMISLPCQVAVRLHGLFPGLSSKLLSLVNYWLPRPGGIGTRSKRGHESKSAWSESALTLLSQRAAYQNNQT